VASRKDEKDRLRDERLAAEQTSSELDKARQRRAMVIAGLVLVLVVAGIVKVVASSSGGPEGDVTYGPNSHFNGNSGVGNDVPGDNREGAPPPTLAQGDLEAAANAANCELKLNLPDEGNTHIGNPAEAEANEPDYKTNPPTSGDHVSPPYWQADGEYSEMPDPVLTVHSIEHGRINVQYLPKLDESVQLEIKGVVDDAPDGMLLFPNPDMPYEVAATAWQQLLGCKTYEGAKTLDAIRDFRDTYLGHGPEAVQISTG
jgi:hypothetical protein